MKRLWYYPAIALCLIFISCSDDDKSVEDEIHSVECSATLTGNWTHPYVFRGSKEQCDKEEQWYRDLNKRGSVRCVRYEGFVSPYSSDPKDWE